MRLAVSLGLFGWLLVFVEWLAVWEALRHTSVIWLLSAIGWILMAMVCSVVKWGLLIRAQGLQAGWVQLWRAYMVGLFFNNFFPSGIGGDGMRILRIGRITGDTAGAAASVAAERLLAMLGLALFGLAGSLSSANNQSQVRVLFVVMLAVSLVLLWLMLAGRVPAFLQNRDGRLAVFASGFMRHGERIRRQPGIFLQAFGWTLVFHLAYMAVNYSLFRGLGIDQLNWRQVMFVIPATAALAALPVGINGYGVREGASVLLLTPYGVERATAFTASVLFAGLVCLYSMWGGVLWMKSCRKEEGYHASIESVPDRQ